MRPAIKCSVTVTPIVDIGSTLNRLGEVAASGTAVNAKLPAGIEHIRRRSEGDGEGDPAANPHSRMSLR